MSAVSTLIKQISVIALAFALVACDQGLHFSIRFDDAKGLKAGDPLMKNDQTVGRVTAVEAKQDRSQLVSVVVERQFAGAATVNTRLYIDEDAQQHKIIEVSQDSPVGKPIEQGAVVIGSTRPRLDLSPFTEILKEFGGMLRGLRDQVERFRQQFEQLPASPEASQLKEEWQRLLQELNEAQNAAEGSVKKDLIPKLEDDLDGIRRRLDELKKSAQPRSKPLET